MRYRIDKLFAVISTILGIGLGIFLELMIYRGNMGASRVPVIVCAIGIFAVIFALVLIVKGINSNSYARSGKMIGLGILALVVLIVFTGVFEFIYEQDFSFSVKDAVTVKTNDRYVFLVDDSGSMDTYDYMETRYLVVESTINGMDDNGEFAVYSFGSNSVCLTPLGSVKPSEYAFDSTVRRAGGLTYMMNAVDRIIDDLEGKEATVIILTDGMPDDEIRMNAIIERCKENNVVINCVGFANAGEEFMEKFATGTGGIFTYSKDVNAISQNVQTVIDYNFNAENIDSDILGIRHKGSALHGLLRVVFLMLMGLLWTGMKELLIGDLRFNKKLAVISLLMTFAGALLTELVLLVLPLWPVDMFVRILFYGLWACTLIPEYLYGANTGYDLAGGGIGERAGASSFETDSWGVGTNSFM